MAAIIRNDMSDMSLSACINAVPGAPAVLHTRLHLVETQSRYEAKLPWSPGVHSPIFALGTYGIQLGSTWNDSKG